MTQAEQPLIQSATSSFTMANRIVAQQCNCLVDAASVSDHWRVVHFSDDELTVVRQSVGFSICSMLYGIVVVAAVLFRVQLVFLPQNGI